MALKLEPIVETLQRRTRFKNPMLTYKTPWKSVLRSRDPLARTQNRKAYKRECQEKTAPLRLGADFFLGIQPTVEEWSSSGRKVVVSACEAENQFFFPVLWGLRPGRSAGVNYSHRSPKGNRHMRRVLNQTANAAARTKGSILWAMAPMA